MSIISNTEPEQRHLRFIIFETEPPHLDADQDAPVPDHFDKGHTIIRVLVQRLMEEDDTSEATVDTIVCAKENLPELSAVLLCVLHPYLGQPFRHAACGEHIVQGALHCVHYFGLLVSSDINSIQVSHRKAGY